jgi:DNA-binding response OmpR family regulator
MGKRVLLCDDEAHILRAAQIKLSHAGYDVSTACDGQEAWESIRTSPPDILVTDLQMPRMDGLELSRRVHEAPETVDLPILMLTAKGFEVTHLEMAEKCGVLAVLPKPFSPRELVRYIDTILKGETTPSR